MTARLGTALSVHYDAAMARRAVHSSSLAAALALALTAAPTFADPAVVVAAPPQAVAPAGPAQSGSADSLQAAYENAVNAFKYQDFENAIPQLRALLYPPPGPAKVRLDQKREWKVREYLGAALWWQGDVKAALDEFTALLVRNPQVRLDPAVYPPKMLADFEGLRQNLVRLGVIKADQKARAPDVAEVVAPAPFELMFFPFGVGQFANRERGRGTAFLIAQTVLAGVSAGAFLYQDQQNRTSTVSDTVRNASGVGFFVVAAWGIVDAVLRYPRSPEGQR